MSWPELGWSSDPLFQAFLLVVAIALVYVARQPAHQLLRRIGAGWYAFFRFAARALSETQRKVESRNSEVVRQLGEERLEARLERELKTLGLIITRDLDTHPTLPRQLGEQLEIIAQDYKASAQLAPQTSAWVSTLDALLRSSSHDQAVVAEIAQAMHATLERSQAQAAAAYRSATRKRHRALASIAARLRQLDSSAQRLQRKVSDVESRLITLGRSLEEFLEVVAGRDAAARRLYTSFFSQFFASALILSVAAAVAYVSFQLILAPLGAWVGAGSTVASFQTGTLAAIAIVALQLSAGLVLTEALGLTRLLGTIQRMDSIAKLRLAWVIGGLVLVLAGIQAALGFMHDAPLAALAGDSARPQVTEAAPTPSEMGTAALVHMMIAFVLALVVAASGMAVDAFLNAGRVVLGALVASSLAGLASAAFLLALLGRGFTRALRSAYDLVIFLPLAFERRSRVSGARRSRPAQDGIAGEYAWRGAADSPFVRDPAPGGTDEDAARRYSYRAEQDHHASGIDGLDFTDFEWHDEPGDRSPPSAAGGRGNGPSLPPPTLQ